MFILLQVHVLLLIHDLLKCVAKNFGKILTSIRNPLWSGVQHGLGPPKMACAAFEVSSDTPHNFELAFLPKGLGVLLLHEMTFGYRGRP